MYGAIITDAVTPDGDFGVFFIHNEGYSSMCGHAIIALTTLIYETGFLNISVDKPFVNIDSPSGRIKAGAKIKQGRIEEAFFENVPSFVLADREVVNIEGIGEVGIDIAFGGAFYAFTEAEPLGLALNDKDYYRLIDIGRRIKKATSEGFEINHPYVPGLSFLYGTIFTGPSGNKDIHSRNVCIFADGEVDRSPTGTGVSARAAIHYQRGELKKGDKIIIESILGTTMGVKIKEQVEYGQYRAVIPEVSGRAFITGRNEFFFDPEDNLREGFIFR
jgi:trans-L-3-hydroxyproline dehydratase